MTDKQKELLNEMTEVSQECGLYEKDINVPKSYFELSEQLDQLKAELDQYKSSKQASYEEMQRRWNKVELENRKLKASLDEKNDLLQKLGISATGEFKRIKYYVDKLVAEKEELKRKKEENDTFYLKKYANKDSECLELQHKVSILKQTLAEIKEFAKGIAKSTYDAYPYGGDRETWEAQRAKQILQKISEVEDE